MDPFAQAQDDLRQERLMAFFRQVLPWAALALAVLLTVIAIREIWTAVGHNVDRSRTEHMVTALNDGDGDSVAALTKIAEDDDGARAGIAALIAFQRMDVEKQKTDGIALLDRTAADENVEKEWRDYAALTATRARLAFGAGEKDADALVKALAPAVADVHSPWQAHAAIETAMIQGEIKKDAKAAFETLGALNHDELTPDLAADVSTLKSRYAQESAEGETP